VNIRGPVLIVGCAYGLTVQALLKRGIDAYGIDISNYAVDRAREFTDLQDRIILGHASSKEAYWKVCQVASVPMFTYIVSENMLCCLTDKEAIEFQKCAEYFSVHILHLIEIRPALAKWYNYKTVKEWQQLLQPVKTRFSIIN
jgi:SAM-dependent methyltransferase